MSLVVDYSSSEDEGIKVNNKKQIFVSKPKKLIDSDNEELENKRENEQNIRKIEFKNLKFQGKGSNLFDILPPVKKIEDEEGALESVKEIRKEIKEVTKPTKPLFIPNSVSKTKTKAKQAESEEPEIRSLFPTEVEDLKSFSKTEHAPIIPYELDEESEEDLVKEDAIQYETNEAYRIDDTYCNQQPTVEESRDQIIQKILPLGGKREMEELKNIEFQNVDLNEELNDDEAIAGLTKSDIQPEFNINRHQLPSIGKRRYNIVYLSQQAKSREAELQEYYNKNKKTRNEAKKRYGF